MRYIIRALLEVGTPITYSPWTQAGCFGESGYARFSIPPIIGGHINPFFTVFHRLQGLFTERVDSIFSPWAIDVYHPT